MPVIRDGAGLAHLEVVVLPSIEGIADSPETHIPRVRSYHAEKERKQREKKKNMTPGPPESVTPSHYLAELNGTHVIRNITM